METSPISIPQPLSGEEIKKGIAERIAAEVSPEHAEAIKGIIYKDLGKTCSLESSTAYSKFKADWILSYWETKDGLHVDWWIEYELDDFGRITKGAIGNRSAEVPKSATNLASQIEETPPDRFRRETSQPIPKVVELKKAEPQQVTFSQAKRGPGRPRNV